MSFLGAYMNWLHTRWPAGGVEKLPAVGADGETSLPGVRITGDLTGIPLLKFSAGSGARAVQAILRELTDAGNRNDDPEVIDLAIVGAGVSGISAALEARKAGLTYRVFEATQVFSTIVNFPKGKPIYTYPVGMKPAGQMRLTAETKETLLGELEAQRVEAGIEPVPLRIERVERKGGEIHLHSGDDRPVIRARRAIIAIGRSGNYRKLNVPGEKLDKVYNRLYDPKDHAGKHALVVGGGDSAIEAAIALASCGAHVTISYRNREFSRPKPGNVERLRSLERNPAADVAIEQPVSDRVTTAAGAQIRGAVPTGSLRLMMASTVKEIRQTTVLLKDASGADLVLPNDVVFAMVGRAAPLDFFRRSGISIRGEWKAGTWLSFLLFLLFCVFLYNWKSGSSLNALFQRHHWFPYNIDATTFGEPSTVLGTIAISLREPSFYYSLAYSICVVAYGIGRMRRRKTPYVDLQTLTLMAIQVLPLFLLPLFVLPHMGHNGYFDGGMGKVVADNLVPLAGYGHGREYWRAFGLILAWPLFVWNLFTEQPLYWWLAIGLLQTFVLIPLIVWRWGKGAYCGWICSCGALAETLGDRHRTKMPHGPFWNRLNMVGQVILALALLLFGLRIIGWMTPDSAAGVWARRLFRGMLSGWSVLGIELNYYHIVDLLLSGIIGVGMYFWFSGRVWCRFACPLAALMHIYARFSRFRIFSEKSKCISCNLCTSVCHQGIDIMSFANKGLPMQDPECVRCSACVQECPTGTLAFGRYAADGKIVLDELRASPIGETVTTS